MTARGLGPRLKTELRLALREMRHNGRFSAAFATNLALGLFGLMFMSAFHASVLTTFAQRSRGLLTADVGISARRAFTEAELTAIGSTIGRDELQRARTVEMYSMLRAGGRSRLAELVAIEPAHPLYGRIELERGGAVESATPKAVIGARAAWIAPELVMQLGVRPGDSVELGSARLRVVDVIRQDSGDAWRGFALAPRIYIGLDRLAETGLVKPGSTVTHRYYFRIRDGVDLDGLALRLNRALPDPGIQVATHQRAGEQTARALTYLADFLGLVALVGLFLSSLGSAYLFQSFLTRHAGQIATLVSLGFPPARVFRVYLLQLGLLGLGAVLASFALAQLTLPLASSVASSLIGIDLHSTPRAPDLGLALLIGISGSILACLPLLLRIREIRPALLFQEGQEAFLAHASAARGALAFVPAALFFFALSVWQARSWRIGGAFFGGLLVSGLLLAGIAWLLLGARPRFRALPARLAQRYVTRNRLSSSSVFLAIGLGATLINLLPQLQRNIEAELERPDVSVIPSLFLFDIQDEQVEGLRTLLPTLGARVSQVSPLVRARIESVNGRPFEKPLESRPMSREEEQESRLRNRGFNLSFRADLTESESIVAGRMSQAPAEITAEFRFAERLGLRVGDRLRFGVQGVPVEGTIVGLRRVRWTSFQPNFLIQFGPGALEDAPKTWLLTVSGADFGQRNRIQSAIVERYSNVSVIDVTALVERMLSLLEQMAWAMRAMAIFAVVTGLVVLFSIARNQVATRRREVQILKVLGASEGLVRRVFWSEFGGLGGVASVVGVVLSTGLSYAISRTFFDGAWDFAWRLPAFTVLAVTSLSLITAHLAIRRTLREKPAALLSAETL